MAKHKRNVLIAGLLTLFAILVASPLDDFFFASVLGHVILGLTLIESLIVGAVIGIASFILLEYFGSEI